jgi:serine-type D-Ala-D-Ala carboxypeptidase (penicillin-binding protein 5/6)
VKRVVLLLVLLAFAGSAHASGLPPVPQVDAKAYLVVDARTGEVLAASHADERLPIASITKLMTVLVALQHHRLSDVVTVDPRAASVGESTAHLTGGEQITVHDLVEAALIQSANDAADALALSVSRDYAAFARLMNAKAQQLGLQDTHFVRPDGLDATSSYSSAADVTRLARTLMRNPFVRGTVRQRTATIAGGRVLHTWDDLLGVVPHVIGVKTGHTGEAGWCQVAAVREHGVTVYVAMLGSPTRSIRNVGLESLLAWGVAQFRVVPEVQRARVYATVVLPSGKRPVDLVEAAPLQGVVRLGHPLTERVIAATNAGLPVHAGEMLGRVEIWANGHLLGSRDLIATRTVRRPGLPGRLGFYAGRTLHHIAHLF